MEGRVCVCLMVVILFLWNSRFVDEVDGCFATVPVDEIKFTTLASKTTTCSVQPQCPSCPADSACVTVCNVDNAAWTPGPGADKGPGDCVDFVGTTEKSATAQSGNVGFLSCNVPNSDTCLSGGAKNIPYGKYEVLNPQTALEITAYCSSPTDCKVLLTNRAGGGEIPLVYKDGPAVSYTFPPDTDLTTDGTYFIVDDICCGTCDACVAKGCNPPYPCPVVG
uniref:Uncharacterized protein n=1 Tax=Plectus sambesii TaxID=2011161 RepID=A0A914WU66_9BILA